jgi:hypothetical protein
MASEFLGGKKKDERLGRSSFPPLIGWGYLYINKAVNRNKGIASWDRF